MNDHTNASKLPPLAHLGYLKMTKVNWYAGSCNYCTEGNPNKEDVYELTGHMIKTRFWVLS